LWCGRRSAEHARDQVTPARRRTEPAGVRIPAELAGPVEVALTRSVDQIPAPNALPGGSRYEVKWDGYLH
jgi:hypothetical protein